MRVRTSVIPLGKLRLADGARRECLDGGIQGVTGEQGGDGDTDLAAGELRRQGLKAVQDGVCGLVAGVFGLLHGGGFEGHEREFDGHEESGSQNE